MEVTKQALANQDIQVLRNLKIEGDYIQDDILYALSLTTVLDEATRRFAEEGDTVNPLIVPTVAMLASRYAGSAYDQFREWYRQLSRLHCFEKGVDRDE